MGVILIEIAKEIVEAFFRGNAFRSLFAQSPFPNERRLVPLLFEHFCHTEVRRFQGDISIRHTTAAIPAHSTMSRVQTRLEGTTGGGTDGATRITLCQSHTLFRQSIEIGREDFFLAEAAEIAVAQIVREDDHQVGPLAALRAQESRRDGRPGKKSTSGWHGW